jgi:hypothetical protein
MPVVRLDDYRKKTVKKPFCADDYRYEPAGPPVQEELIAEPAPRPGNRGFLYDSMERITAGLDATGIVWVYLLRRSTVERSREFTVPNGELAKLGVNRYQKSRALQKLEKRGLIEVEWRVRKSPLVTLLIGEWHGHAVRRSLLQKRTRSGADL